MSKYVTSPELEMFLDLAATRMAAGLTPVLFLQGPPGSGKTSLAYEVAERLEGDLYYYAGAPDKERDLLYDIDVGGIVRREGAWLPGPAWQAFAASHSKPAVLLIDEIDKTAPSFDAFLLRLLEEFAFRSPEDESDIKANRSGLVVVLTSNGRRELRPEVLRRCQRVEVPRPHKDLLVQIVGGLAPDAPPGLVKLVVRIGEALASKVEPELAPSPKELALLCIDLGILCGGTARGVGVSTDLIRTDAVSWLVKEGGPEAIDAAVPSDLRKWAAALKTEARR